MIINFVFSELSDKEKVEKFFENKDVELHLIDDQTKKGKKEGWALKNKWAARLSPFCEIKDYNGTTKLFYSEACNVIKELEKL